MSEVYFFKFLKVIFLLSPFEKAYKTPKKLLVGLVTVSLSRRYMTLVARKIAYAHKKIKVEAS